MVCLQGIKKTFGKGDSKVEALKGVDLLIKEGEMIAIMGKSGSGKSTLLNILGGLSGMDEGKYLFQGKALDCNTPKELTKFRRDNIGFVVQYFALVEEMTVFQNVAMPLKYQKKKRSQIKERVEQALEELEILDKAKAYPMELSGGQQQRVSIARALVKDAKLILADEPTGALDEATGEKVLEIFEKLHKEGKTIVIVTHDEKVASRCERVLHLKDGRWEEKENVK